MKLLLIMLGCFFSIALSPFETRFNGANETAYRAFENGVWHLNLPKESPTLKEILFKLKILATTSQNSLEVVLSDEDVKNVIQDILTTWLTGRQLDIAEDIDIARQKQAINGKSASTKNDLITPIVTKIYGFLKDQQIQIIINLTKNTPSYLSQYTDLLNRISASASAVAGIAGGVATVSAASGVGATLSVGAGAVSGVAYAIGEIIPLLNAVNVTPAYKKVSSEITFNELLRTIFEIIKGLNIESLLQAQRATPAQTRAQLTTTTKTGSQGGAPTSSLSSPPKAGSTLVARVPVQAPDLLTPATPYQQPDFANFDAFPAVPAAGAEAAKSGNNTPQSVNRTRMAGG